MDAQIEREKFMLCFGERMIFKRRSETPGLFLVESLESAGAESVFCATTTTRRAM